jgi:hypothetical protein
MREVKDGEEVSYFQPPNNGSNWNSPRISRLASHGRGSAGYLIMMPSVYKGPRVAPPAVRTGLVECFLTSMLSWLLLECLSDISQRFEGAVT